MPADPLWFRRLLGRGLYHRKDGYEYAAFGFGIVLNATVDESEQGVVFADADILASVPFGAALTRQDIAGGDVLPAEQLHAEPPTLRVATVARRPACLFMSHGSIPNSVLLYSDSVTESSHKY
jgi:hypothetical protein